MTNIVEFISHEDRERRERCREVVAFARQRYMEDLIDWSLVEAYQHPAPKVFRFSDEV